MNTLAKPLVVGQTFSQAFTISPEIYEGFIALFNDKNPLHTSEQFANGYGFTSKVVHGNILNGFLSYFVGECLPVKNVIIHSQEISYKAPVFINDSLQLTATVEEIFESVNAVEIKYIFTNQKNQKVAKGSIQVGFLTLKN